MSKCDTIQFASFILQACALSILTKKQLTLQKHDILIIKILLNIRIL
jgi:hypothetical protein